MAQTLSAAKRTDFGKGAARRYRRDGRVPAVIYGHGDKPVHVTLDSHELTQMLRHKVTSLSVDLEGTTYNVAPRDVQLEPVRRYIEHLDLVIVTAAEAAAIAREAAAASAKAEADALAAAASAAAKADARAARQAETGAEEAGAESAE